MGKSVNQSTNYRTSQATHQGLLFIVCISVINLWMRGGNLHMVLETRSDWKCTVLLEGGKEKNKKA